MSIEHVGPSRPMDMRCALPPQLASLLGTHGPGILGGLLQLAPPGCDAHAPLQQAFLAASERRSVSAAWLPLRSPRGSRATLLGGTVGSASGTFVLFDGRSLFALTRSAQVAEVGADLEALMEALQRGLHDKNTMPPWLSDALKEAPDALGIPTTYDTRIDTSFKDFRDAIAENESAKADTAFEAFADARSTGRRIVEAQQILDASPPNNLLAEWRKLIARMAARNAIAVQFAAEPEAESAPIFARLEALGFQPEGALTEDAARVLTGSYAFDPAPLEAAFTRLGRFGPLGSELEVQLHNMRAVDVFVWLASVRSGRVGGVALRGATPLALDALPPLATHWPILVLALLTQDAFAWASPHCVTLLVHAADRRQGAQIPLREILLVLLQCLPGSFANGASGLAAEAVHAIKPASSAEAKGWVATVRAKSKLPKRSTDVDRDADGLLALLERSGHLEEVRSFFTTDVLRAPYAALAAARRVSSASGRDILHAIYTSAVPTQIKLSAAELAHERGDGRAQSLLPSLQKSADAEGRKLDRM